MSYVPQRCRGNHTETGDCSYLCERTYIENCLRKITFCLISSSADLLMLYATVAVYMFNYIVKLYTLLVFLNSENGHTDNMITYTYLTITGMILGIRQNLDLDFD